MQHHRGECSTHSFSALGTIWHIEADLPKSKLVALEQTSLAFQHKYSRFEKDSVLYTLNATKHLKKPPQELIAMLNYCTQITLLSDGIFNPTVGATLAKYGYGKQKGSYQKNWTEKITISREEILLDEDTILDFGGFGKGWLVDVLYDILIENGATTIVVNGGGDIRVLNTDGVDLPIMLPGVPTKTFLTATITQGSIATSSPLLRTWGDTNQYTHLIDSSGDFYNGKIVQLSTYQQTALLADTFATVLILHPKPIEFAAKLKTACLYVEEKGVWHASRDFPIAI